MRDSIRVLAVCLTALAAAAAGLVLPAQADETDTRNKLNFKGVDTYYSTTWRRGSGDCRNAWKIVNSQYRFHRDYRARYVRVREFRMTEQFSSDCNNTAVHKAVSESHNACFGCNGSSPNWSRLYSYSPRWPYLLPADFAVAHTMLKVTVKKPSSSSTVTLGRFCRASYRFGGTPCP